MSHSLSLGTLSRSEYMHAPPFKRTRLRGRAVLQFPSNHGEKLDHTYPRTMTITVIVRRYQTIRHSPCPLSSTEEKPIRAPISLQTSDYQPRIIYSPQSQIERKKHKLIKKHLYLLYSVAKSPDTAGRGGRRPGISTEQKLVIHVRARPCPKISSNATLTRAGCRQRGGVKDPDMRRK